MNRCNHYGCAFDCYDAPWNQDGGPMTKTAILRRYCTYLHSFGSKAYYQSREHMWWLDPIKYAAQDI